MKIRHHRETVSAKKKYFVLLNCSAESVQKVRVRQIYFLSNLFHLCSAVQLKRINHLIDQNIFRFYTLAAHIFKGCFENFLLKVYTVWITLFPFEFFAIRDLKKKKLPTHGLPDVSSSSEANESILQTSFSFPFQSRSDIAHVAERDGGDRLTSG